MLAVDTETTGKDLFHGALPFFVSTCDDTGTQLYWEWDVDPLTRKSQIPEEDIDDVRELIFSHDTLVLQNAKFDVLAFSKIGIDDWPWEKTEDTLIAGHLLYSNEKHDLTSMAVQYLRENIEPWEKALEKACDKARDFCRRHLKDWAIAVRGRADMPSAKEKVWKYDTWLPRALCKWAQKERKKWLDQERPKHKNKNFTYKTPWFYDYGDLAHPWLTVLKDYALVDSAVTYRIWEMQRKMIYER